MEKLHGILEWIPAIMFALSGLILDRWVPAKRARYPVWVALLLTAFIMDLNMITFKADIFDIIFWSLILMALSEFFWISVRKKSRLLLGGAVVMLSPVFVYVYFALVMALPFPCHEDKRAAMGGGHECSAGAYSLRTRPSFDIFNPSKVVILERSLKYAPWLRKQVDKYELPKGYMAAVFTPQWKCAEGKYRGGASADLYIDGYVLWTLKEEPKND